MHQHHLRLRRTAVALGLVATFTMGAGAASAQRINVPADQPTIAAALSAAVDGDTILVSPGTYHENLVLAGKNVTLASLYLTTRDPSYVDRTVIDGGGGKNTSVISVERAQVTPVDIIGLTLQNADDCITSRGAFNLLNSRITGCTDGIDYESGSSGFVRYNLFEGNRDDGIDFDDDIAIVVENNLIRNNQGDGIEIRLQPYRGPVLRSVIRGNTITGNHEDGIQLIGYPDATDREYLIERNHIVDNRQAGIGCMSDAISREDYRAAALPEPIWIIDNFIRGNERDISCGRTVLDRNGIALSPDGTSVIPTAAATNVPADPLVVFATWSGDPTTTVTLDWHLEAGGSLPYVEVRGPGRESWTAFPGTAIEFPFSDRMVYRAHVTGLHPDAEYEIRFAAGGRTWKHQTMPQTATRPIRFAIGGDTRAQDETFGRMNRIVAAHDVDFVVFGGDLAYSNGDPRLLEREIEWWETLHNSLVTDNGRLIPVLAAIGNHEVISAGRFETPAVADSLRRLYGVEPEDAPYYDALIARPGTERYRTIDFGDYLSILLLDTNHKTPIEGAQTDWLRSALASRTHVPHVFPVYHVPGYPSVRRYDGSTSEQVREQWAPLFDEYGVAIAFENHDHVYKRTVPIRGNAEHPEGVVYLGDGSWGAGPREIGRDHEPSDAWYLANAISTLHAILVTLDGDDRQVRVIDGDNRTIDELTRPATREAQTAP